MNMLAATVAQVRSGVVHLNFFRNGERVSAGTGFMLKGYLVTNNHVYAASSADEVMIRLHDSDPKNRCDGIRIEYQTFQGYLEVGAPKSSYDYAVFTVPELKGRDLYQFDFERITTPCLGREYAILGYPLDHYNLTLHRGIVSSFFERNGVQVIQLDASVNNGNSGGPLIELTDGNVVGIVTRKQTGFSDIFDQLKATIKSNIENLRNAALAPIPIQGVNPNEGLREGQEQLLKLCSQLERSANTGIGYAFSIEHLAEENILQNDES